MFGLIPWRRKNTDGGALMTRPEFPLNRLREEFDAIFDRFFRGWPLPVESDWELGRFWGMDLEETDKEYLVRAEAPGFEASDFDIAVTGNLLTIKAERKHEEEKTEGTAKYTERRYGRFERSVTLPAGADPDKIEAKYRNGVLEVHVAKSPEAQPRRIEVKV